MGSRTVPENWLTMTAVEAHPSSGRSAWSPSIMKRTCIFIAMALFGLTRTLSAASTNWPPAGYVEVRAYLYNLEGEQAAHILEQGKLNASVWTPKGVALNQAQIAGVRKAVADYPPAGLTTSASCYQPRHGFVYYDSKHTPIGFVEICFSCRGSRTSPEHPGPVDLEALKKVFLELKIPDFDKNEVYLTLNIKSKR